MSAADPRGNEPFYVDPDCSTCGTRLVLLDVHRQSDVPVEPGEIWHDEWWCPACEDGIHMDWPESAFERLTERSESEARPFEEL